MSLKSLVTEGLTTEQTKGALIAIWRMSVAFLWIYLFLGVPTVGLQRPARADEVDKKIRQAIEPIREEMSEQRTILNAVAAQLSETLAENKAAEIRHLVSRRCKETNANERDRINREIDRKQDEYAKLRGKRYEIRCEDV